MFFFGHLIVVLTARMIHHRFRDCEDKVSVLGSITVSEPWFHTLVSVGVVLHRIAFWKLSRAASSRAFKLDH